MLVNSSNTTPLGPRQVAVDLNVTHTFSAAGAKATVTGSVQPFVPHVDGTNPAAMGTPASLLPAAHPAMVKFTAILQAACQELVNAMGV